MADKMQGTRIYYAPSGTAWTPLAAGVAPAGTFIEITDAINVRVVPHEVERFENAPLSATASQPSRELKPGNITFSKNLDAQSVTLRGFCDSQAAKVFAVLYLSGQADTVTGKLICTKGAEAQKGDFRAHVNEDYQVEGDTVVTRQAASP